MGKSQITQSAWSLALLGLLALSSCFAGDGLPPAIPGGVGGSTTFSVGDLEGDWTGLLDPAREGKDTFNFYFRFDAEGIPFAAADGLGHDWRADSSGMESTVHPQGAVHALVAEIRDAVGHTSLELSGELNRSRNLLRGTYELKEFGAVVSMGTFEATRSTGTGHFQRDILDGNWDGYGFKTIDGQWRLIDLRVDPDGTVRGGDLDGRMFLRGGVNTAVFTYGISAVGRLDNVVIQYADGSTITFDYLLVDETGSVMSGPGFDSTLGPGRARLGRSR